MMINKTDDLFEVNTQHLIPIAKRMSGLINDLIINDCLFLIKVSFDQASAPTANDRVSYGRC